MPEIQLEKAVSIEMLLVAVGILLVVSILASKASGRLGVPALVLFLTIGMLAGSEGLGGIYFDDAETAQWIGVIALAFILFAGGLETNWSFVRPSIRAALSLSTLGVFLTSACVALAVFYFLGLPLPQAFLLGAIVSSTDAAAVFSILRSKGVHLNERLASTLELESGSNDPMAVFLTAASIQYLLQPSTTFESLALDFVLQMSLGALFGYMIGVVATLIVNRLHLEYVGLYPVLTIAVVMLTYGGAAALGGNGFLAVYIAGIVMANRNFVHRRRLTAFHDGLAWLMQIAMFLVLGLLVFPSELVEVAWVGIAVALVLIFIARPVAVFVSLAFTSLGLREKTLISWVGLRGAVPIILATFPLLAGAPGAAVIFNVVFFIVLTSVILQGTTIPLVARWLRVDVPTVPDLPPGEPAFSSRRDSALLTIEVAEGSQAAGRKIVQLPQWPREALILVVYRDDEFFLPVGGTELKPDDRLIVLTSKKVADRIRAIGAAPGVGSEHGT